MNKSVDFNLGKLKELLQEMSHTKVSNYSQYCDLLKTHVFSNWRDAIKFYLENLEKALVVPVESKEEVVKAEKPKGLATKVVKAETVHP